MKLHRENQEDWTHADWLVELQLRVGRRFEVFPVDSSRAYEEFEGEDSAVVRIVHKAFCVQVPGTSAIEVAKAVEMLWRDICEVFQQGTPVVWRLRPALQTVDENCEHCGQPAKKHIVRLRLGGIAPNISSSPQTLVQEGSFKPYARSV